MYTCEYINANILNNLMKVFVTTQPPLGVCVCVRAYVCACVCVCVCVRACVYVMGEAGPRGHVDSHRWWPELQMEVGVGGLGGLGPLPLTGAPSVGGRGVNLGGDPSGDVEASSAG